jgi:spermidine/putrescine transport system permease protein
VGRIPRPLRDAAQARERARALALVAPAAAWTLAFFAAPFVVMAALSFRPLPAEGEAVAWGLGAWAKLAEPALAGAFLNSLAIAATVTAVATPLGFALAWLIAEEVPPRWRRAALALAVIPFWTSYVVRSYAWALVLAKGGVLNDALAGLGLPPLALANSRAATVIGFVHFFTMLCALTAFASLAQLPPTLRRAAADLGAGPWGAFRHVVLPLCLPGIATGAFLTFALCLGDYVTPQVLGGGQELTLPQAIMMQLGRRADLPTAAALSLALMGAVTVVWLAAARWLRLSP